MQRLVALSTILIAIGVAAASQLAAAAETAGGSISFTLDKPGRTSLAVYSADGAVQLRSLLVGERLEAGKHAVDWDGLDRDGRPVEPGTYQWKLVTSPGIEATFLNSVGADPPAGPWAKWVGNHIGPNTIAVGPLGICIGMLLDKPVYGPMPANEVHKVGLAGDDWMSGGSIVDLGKGEGLWFALSGDRSMAFRVRGFRDLERQDGKIELKSAAKAAGFDGDGLNLADYTVSFWFKAPEAAGTIGILQSGADFFLKDGRVVANQGGWYSHQPAGASLADGQWHHAAFTWIQAKRQQQLYVDGALVATNHGPQGAGHSGGAVLGRANTGSGGDAFIGGSLDEFRIYARCLSAEEVKALTKLVVGQ